MVPFDSLDTIAAIASPPGPSIRGIVRLTGPRAWEIALEGFDDQTGHDRTAHAEVRSGRKRVSGIGPSLPVSVTLWREPNTYTGQTLAEIHTVGSAPLLNALLADCVAHGARPAERGEFTLRAFLSGRLDLTRAEAVLRVIEARNPAQLDAALRQLAGGLATPIQRLRDRLLDVLAHLEAGLDFVDEDDVDPIGRTALARELAAGADEIKALADRLNRRDRPSNHPRIVLVGPPNAGKSRLFNALVGETRAIVSPLAGTTTDYLIATCDFDWLRVELVDTAGIDSAGTAIEGRAQAHRHQQVEQADLRVYCLPPDAIAGDDSRLTDRTLIVQTKSDIASNPVGPLATSAATGAGLVELKSAIAAALRQDDAGDDVSSSTGARCREGLLRTAESLRSASSTLAVQGGDELVAFDLRQALDELGKVVGAVVTDDILDRIFRKFCIGK
jgi:tRNA modification GTPase